VHFLNSDWTPELVDLSKTRRKDVSSGNFWVMTGKGPQRAPKVMRKRGRKRVVSAEVIVSSKSSTSSSVSSSDGKKTESHLSYFNVGRARSNFLKI
jgi:hypothetical protein